MITKNEQEVYDVLDKLDIPYRRYEHEAVYTIKELDNQDIDFHGEHCKNLFVRNRKGNVHYLIVVEGSKRVDLKKISEQIGSTPLSFASEERLYKHLELKPGSVTPMGLINDRDKKVIVVIDKDLMSLDSIGVHPNVNTATITLSYENLQKFLKWCQNKVQYVEI
jgi:Ala-tRNA(Pro) deacylase